MRPPSKTAAYYPTAQPPAPSMGIPAASTNQYYPQSVPSALQIQSRGANNPWSTGLCQCFDDVGNCCITCCCPCITFGRVAEIVDRGSSSCGTNGALYTLIAYVTWCPCLYSFFYRSKMRRQYGLAGGNCGDCVVHCFCGSCALCQEYRELKSRGFDMLLGWQANLERQARAVTVPPPVAGGMTHSS